MKKIIHFVPVLLLFMATGCGLSYEPDLSYGCVYLYNLTEYNDYCIDADLSPYYKTDDHLIWVSASGISSGVWDNGGKVTKVYTSRLSKDGITVEDFTEKISKHNPDAKISIYEWDPSAGKKKGNLIVEWNLSEIPFASETFTDGNKVIYTILWKQL